jgi:hypothetical protein
MLLRGAELRPRVLNEMDVDLMRRHASTHDRIQNLNWQNRDSPRNGNNNNRNGNRGYQNSQGNGSQGYQQYQGQGSGYGNQPMKSFPPAAAPGVPASNLQASQWYEQTSTNGGHSSGIMRMDDLQAQFGGAGTQSSQSHGGYQSRGGYGDEIRGGYGGRGGTQDRSRNDRGYGDPNRGGYGGSGGSGHYQGPRHSGSGSGSAYRDNRRR